MIESPAPAACRDVAWQRRRLTAWLREWHLDQRLRDSSEAGSAEAVTATARMARRRTVLAPGRIVLLPPAPGAGPADRPLYVLLLEALPDGAFQAAPFGRFSVPAVPGEWQTGLPAGPVRVLCLWNARRIPRPLLAAGWPAGGVRRRVLDGALRRLQQADRPSIDSGPPLLHPLDPRHRYLMEDRQALEAALRLADSATAGARPAPGYGPTTGVLRQAADRRHPYGSAAPLHGHERSDPITRR